MSVEARVSQAEQVITGLGLIQKGRKIAMCRHCDGEPLVATFYFRKKEFICLSCGCLYEFLEPRPAEETPELLEVMESRKAEWKDNASGLLNPASWRDGCEQCARGSGPYHIEHAAAEELTAHAQSAVWVRSRTGRQDA